MEVEGGGSPPPPVPGPHTKLMNSNEQRMLNRRETVTGIDSTIILRNNLNSIHQTEVIDCAGSSIASTNK